MPLSTLAILTTALPMLSAQSHLSIATLKQSNLFCDIITIILIGLTFCGDLIQEVPLAFLSPFHLTDKAHQFS
jgi:hypothetical protein